MTRHFFSDTFLYVLGDPEVTANIYRKSRNLPKTDTQNYSTDLRRDEDPRFFSTDPDPAQLKKKFRILIRPDIEMKKKIYSYFR